MRNIWTIARRDFGSYFTSPIAYIVIALFLFVTGFMFFGQLSAFNFENMQYQMMNVGKGRSLTEGIIIPVYGNMNVVFLLMVPLITMRLFAEERKLHTLELLMTSPVTLTEIILGKFLSAFLMILVMLGLTLVYPAILFMTGNPDPGAIFTTYLGTLLLVSCYLSFGLFFSSLTENQIVASALTFVTGLFFWLISWGAQSAGPVWSEVLTYLSLINHYNNFSQGTLNVTDVVYYLSFIGFGLFLTHRVLDSFRWR